jgi:small subunit ribosomal protein S6
MRKYELPIVIPSDVTDDAVTGVVQTVQGWIEAESGTVSEINVWGRRHLAYPIAEYREGTYVLIRMEIPQAGLPELDRNLKLSQQVLRYLIVRMDE